MLFVLSRLEKGSDPRSTPRSGLDTSLPGLICEAETARALLFFEFDLLRVEVEALFSEA